jgi:hypothetical protein
MSQLAKPRKVSCHFNHDDDEALKAIKQHYGFGSDAAALRRAVAEHAKQIKAEAETTTITYSRRVY